MNNLLSCVSQWFTVISFPEMLPMWISPFHSSPSIWDARKKNDTVGVFTGNSLSVSAMRYDLQNEHITINKWVQMIDQRQVGSFHCLVKSKIAKLLKCCQLFCIKSTVTNIFFQVIQYSILSKEQALSKKKLFINFPLETTLYCLVSSQSKN